MLPFYVYYVKRGLTQKGLFRPQFTVFQLLIIVEISEKMVNCVFPNNKGSVPLLTCVYLIIHTLFYSINPYY